MAITYFPFTPSNKSAPQFQPTFDGLQFTVIVTWSLFGQRFYVNCYALDGSLQFALPLIESNAGLTIEALAFSLPSGLVTLTTATPHGYALGTLVNLTVAGCAPDAFNGAFQCAVASPTTLTYPLASDPGAASVFGSISYLISMTAGYFDSTLVFRNGQFEVSP